MEGVRRSLAGEGNARREAFQKTVVEQRIRKTRQRERADDKVIRAFRLAATFQTKDPARVRGWWITAFREKDCGRV